MNGIDNNLDNKTVTELKYIAEKYNITGRSKMRRDELIDAIKQYKQYGSYSPSHQHDKQSSCACRKNSGSASPRRRSGEWEAIDVTYRSPSSYTNANRATSPRSNGYTNGIVFNDSRRNASPSSSYNNANGNRRSGDFRFFNGNGYSNGY